MRERARLRGDRPRHSDARDEFIANTARELHPPVAGIKTNAQLAIHALANATPGGKLIVQGCLNEIVAGADLLELLTKNLTDAAGTRTAGPPIVRSLGSVSRRVIPAVVLDGIRSE